MTQWHVTQEPYTYDVVQQIAMQALAKVLRVGEASTGCSHNRRLPFTPVMSPSDCQVTCLFSSSLSQSLLSKAIDSRALFRACVSTAILYPVAEDHSRHECRAGDGSSIPFPAAWLDVCSKWACTATQTQKTTSKPVVR